MNIHELTALNVRTGLPFTKMHAYFFQGSLHSSDSYLGEELTARGKTCPCVHGAPFWVLIIGHIRCILMHVRYITCVLFMFWVKNSLEGILSPNSYEPQ